MTITQPKPPSLLRRLSSAIRHFVRGCEATHRKLDCGLEYEHDGPHFDGGSTTYWKEPPRVRRAPPPPPPPPRRAPATIDKGFPAKGPQR